MRPPAVTTREPESAAPERDGSVAIVAVLVLYRCSLEQSATWQSLKKQCGTEAEVPGGFRLLVCANDAGGDVLEVPRDLPEWVEVVGVAENRGLAWAYDYALRQAEAAGAEWLLTLDQDTDLPDAFLPTMQARARDLRSRSDVAAIVPGLVNDRGGDLSPRLAGLLGERGLEAGFRGVARGDLRAYNSGALLRVAALRAIGGYDRRFWLDYLDHAVFHALYRHGFAVWVEEDMVLRHGLSLEDDRQGMRPERFRNFAMAEAAFRDLYTGWAGRVLFLGRLVMRAVNQKRRGDPAHFFETTMRSIRERVMLSRRERLRRWEAATAGLASVPEITVRQRAVLGRPV